MENYQDQNNPQNYQNSNFNNGNGNFMVLLELFVVLSV